MRTGFSLLENSVGKTRFSLQPQFNQEVYPIAAAEPTIPLPFFITMQQSSSTKGLPGKPGPKTKPDKVAVPDQARRLPSNDKLNVKVPEGYLAVAYIVGVHGLDGDVKAEMFTDFPERFEEGLTLFLGEKMQKMLVEEARLHKMHMLLKFRSVDRREDANLLRNQWLFVAEEDAVELDEDEFWVHDILGLTVQTTDGKRLGTIIDVLHTGANDVYVIQNADVSASQKEILMPAIEQVIQSVDLEAGVMMVTLLPGILDAVVVNLAIPQSPD